MKYCEKCGNKLKHDSVFCENCGTKISNEENKLKNKEEEKEKLQVDEEINEEYTDRFNYQYKPKKSGKGKLILLVILNIILISTTILFLILWLTKSTNCSETSTSKPDETEKTKPTTNNDIIVGKWEQNVEYKTGNEVTRRTYGMIELKSDKTFNSVFYDKDDLSNSERLNGTYSVSSSNDVIYLTYKEDGKTETATLYINDDKMCIGSIECDDYLVKDSYNNKVVIYDDDVEYSSVNYIDYTYYKNFIDDKDTFILVVVHDGCSWCEKYKSVVEEINKNFLTPVYFYENDGNLGVTATPTTLIIKDGELVNKYEGYTTYDNIKTIINEDGIY